MWSQLWTIRLLLCVAGLTRAQTPPGVFPQVSNNLVVSFKGNIIDTGSMINQGAVGDVPAIGLSKSMTSKSTQKYLFVMVDLDYTGGSKAKRDVAINGTQALAQIQTAGFGSAPAVAGTNTSSVGAAQALLPTGGLATPAAGAGQAQRPTPAVGTAPAETNTDAPDNGGDQPTAGIGPATLGSATENAGVDQAQIPTSGFGSASAQFGAAPQAQPTDVAHVGGKGIYLQAFIQNYVPATQKMSNGGTLLEQSSNGPAGYIAPIPVHAAGHRYMMLLFAQPPTYTISTSIQGAIQKREGFDIRSFMQSGNIGQPQAANWFIVNDKIPGPLPAAAKGPPSGAAAPSAPASAPAANTPITYLTSTTLPNGGPVITYPTKGIPSGAIGPAVPVTTVMPTTTTFANGGPTVTFMTTAVITGGDGVIGSTHGITLSNAAGPASRPWVSALEKVVVVLAAVALAYL